MMQESELDRDSVPLPANDDAKAARARVEVVVLRIARLIGRQMAREAFERIIPANDNNGQAGAETE